MSGGGLVQGNKYGIKGTSTIEFISKLDIPFGRDIIYAMFVCDERPLKLDPFRIRIEVGGDKLSYDEDAGSPATDLLETKLLANSTISDSFRPWCHFYLCRYKRLIFGIQYDTP